MLTLMGARVDIGVGGRFHADKMAEQLGGEFDVHLYTSLPPSRFSLRRACSIHSHPLPEVIYRMARKVGLDNWGDLYKMKSFGRAMARDIKRSGHHARAFVGWSSFSLETLRLAHAEQRFLVRDSAHILFQSRILQEEFEKHAVAWPNRSACEERELEEYELADRIIVLSEFARETFLKAGVSPEKIVVLPLGLDLTRFTAKTIKPVTAPLQLLYFGSLSLRKGVQHLLEATRDFSPDTLQLTFIGGIEPHFHPILKKYSHAKYLPPLPQAQLAKRLQDFDAYVLPTLEDGFGQTLPQAMASGLVPIVSENCGARDFVESGVNGFRIPAGSVGELRRTLLKLTEEPGQIASLAEKAIQSASSRTWESYGKDLRAIVGAPHSEASASASSDGEMGSTTGT